MKKKIAFILVCASLFGTSVCAEDIKVSNNGYSVTVTAEAEPGSKATMFVVKKGESVDNNNAIFAIKQGVADESGTLEFMFDMPESADGEYTVYARQSGGDEMSPADFVYVSDETKENFNIELRKVKSEDDLAEVLEAEENKLTLLALGFTKNEYDMLGDREKSEVIALAYEAASYDDITNKSAASCFNKAYALVRNDVSKGGFEFEGVLFGDESEEKQKWISEAFENADSVKEAEEEYALLCILYEINNARFSQFEKLFDKYEDLIREGYEDVYEDYSDLKSKNKVNEKLENILEKNNAKSRKELADALENAMDENTSSDKKGNSGGGGGGGGSKGSAVNAVPTAPTQEKVKEEETQEDIFNDMIQAEWAKEAVLAANKKGIVSGDGSGKFYPNRPVTREEFVKMLVLALGIADEESVCDFDDVPGNSWYYPYVAAAYKNGIVNGVDENNFGTGNSLTRQDMTVMVYRAVSSAGKLPEVNRSADFSDSNEISEYAKEAVEILSASGAVNGMGDNRFEPFTVATRAQSVQLIYNLLLK